MKSAMHRRHRISPIRGDRNYADSIKRLDIGEIGARRGLNSFNIAEYRLWLKERNNNGTYIGRVFHSLTQYVFIFFDISKVHYIWDI